MAEKRNTHKQISRPLTTSGKASLPTASNKKPVLAK